jgi:hypothetical protein
LVGRIFDDVFFALQSVTPSDVLVRYFFVDGVSLVRYGDFGDYIFFSFATVSRL